MPSAITKMGNEKNGNLEQYWSCGKLTVKIH